MDVTTAFQQHLNQRRMNICNMFKNPQDCLDEDNMMSKANDDEELDEEDEEKEEDIHAGCMSKAEDDDEDLDEEDEDDESEDEDEEEDDDERSDTEKAEIINLIGIHQLDVWKARVNDIQNDKSLTDFEKASETMKLDAEISEFASKSEVEKSDILYALNGYENKISFKKKGSEIIEQINNVVLPLLNTELATAEAKAGTLMEDCGEAPIHDVPEYWTGDLHIEIPFKTYSYEETRYNSNNGGKEVCDSCGIYDAMNQNCNPATTAEEACARNSYNEQVRKIANICTDIKTCEILARNLTKGEIITLTVRQLLALKFV